MKSDQSQLIDRCIERARVVRWKSPSFLPLGPLPFLEVVGKSDIVNGKRRKKREYNARMIVD